MSTTTLLGLPLSLTLSPASLALLRIAPLLGTTASLTHAWMENLTVSSFLWTPSTRSALTLALAKNAITPQSPDSSKETPDDASRTQSIATAKQTLIPIWFTNFFTTGVWSVISLNTVSLVSSLANILLFPFPASTPASTKLAYRVGLAAVLAHYAFVPLVAGSVARLVGMCVSAEKGEVGQVGSAERDVREWVGWHRIRVCTVDLVAWGAFVVGVSGAVGAL